MPEVILGESIIAFVTTYDHLLINETEIHRQCIANLEAFMVPQKIIMLAKMPKSSNGKIDKAALKKILSIHDGRII
jgi:acyl-coenzyme A synthetase/AMP-(fatty) acid ligase